MTRFTRRQSAAFGLPLVLAAALTAPLAHGGQVRVNVGPAGSQTFAPYAININQGDHVVWVWLGSMHTVANLGGAADSTSGNYDGSIFDSMFGGAHLGQGSTTRFSWKSSQPGQVQYVCVPHIDTMRGWVFVSPLTQPPTIPVADFRLTEVLFNDPGGHDLIEIANLGAGSGDLQSFRLAVIGTGLGVPISSTTFPVLSGGRVVVHTNETGTNNTPPGHIYLSALGALNDAAGSISLYVPSTLAPQNALTTSSMMLDFVQWGAGAQANETTAGAAGFWTSGESINAVAPGHSIEYCANPPALGHGIGRWAEIFPTNFGSNNDCADPILTQTWGHLKVLYRP